MLFWNFLLFLVTVIFCYKYSDSIKYTLFAKKRPYLAGSNNNNIIKTTTNAEKVKNNTPPQNFYPKEFLDSYFDEETKRRKDVHIGNYMNAGVIYDDDFRKKQYENAISIKEPAAYTPFIQDYVLHVKRPPVKPMPMY